MKTGDASCRGPAIINFSSRRGRAVWRLIVQRSPLRSRDESVVLADAKLISIESCGLAFSLFLVVHSPTPSSIGPNGTLCAEPVHRMRVAVHTPPTVYRSSRTSIRPVDITSLHVRAPLLLLSLSTALSSLLNRFLLLSIAALLHSSQVWGAEAYILAILRFPRVSALISIS